MKTCDICGLPEANGEWFAYNDEHNLILCPICEKFAATEHDNDKVWRFGDIRRKQLAAKMLGSLGGASGTGEAKRRGNSDYYSQLAKKRKK